MAKKLLFPVLKVGAAATCYGTLSFALESLFAWKMPYTTEDDRRGLVNNVLRVVHSSVITCGSLCTFAELGAFTGNLSLGHSSVLDNQLILMLARVPLVFFFVLPRFLCFCSNTLVQ